MACQYLEEGSIHHDHAGHMKANELLITARK